MEILGKAALVTSGARRLGREMALALAEQGAKVAISYLHSEPDALSTVQEIEHRGGEAAAFQADITSPLQLESLIANVVDRFSRLDILVNNAAIFRKTPLDQVTEQDWDEFIDVNLKSTFFCSQFAARVMREQGAGKIINMACTSGERPWPSFIPYSASKAGVISLTRSMALALAPQIQVNAIAPGPVLLPDNYTPEERERAVSATLLRRAGSPKDVQRTVVFLVSGSDYVTGQILAVDGGRLNR